MIDALALVGILMLSIKSWYLVYGLECYVNGGAVHGSKWWQMHWGCFQQDVQWLTRRGRQRYAEQAARNGSHVDPDMLPGAWHFCFTHIVLPFGPAAVYCFIRFVF